MPSQKTKDNIHNGLDAGLIGGGGITAARQGHGVVKSLATRRHHTQMKNTHIDQAHGNLKNKAWEPHTRVAHAEANRSLAGKHGAVAKVAGRRAKVHAGGVGVGVAFASVGAAGLYATHKGRTQNKPHPFGRTPAG